MPVTFYKLSAPALKMAEFDMPSDAYCNNPNFDPENPADGLISCQLNHEYQYFPLDDGDK